MVHGALSQEASTMSTLPPYSVVSNLCAHLDPKGAYFFVLDCPICTPLQYRCLYCYQVGSAKDCVLSSGHVLAVYPFKCDACKGSVNFKQPTICEDSHDARHLLASGFVSMGLTRVKVEARDTAYDQEIAGYLSQLRGSRLTRRFVSKAR